jgi:hypothetical protein
VLLRERGVQDRVPVAEVASSVKELV